MSAYVRVCKLEEFRLAVDRAGTQTDVAAAARVSLQRLNQLYVGTHDVLEVRKAARLERVLAVPVGSLFAAVDAPLLIPYMPDPADLAGGFGPPREHLGRDATTQPLPVAY